MRTNFYLPNVCFVGILGTAIMLTSCNSEYDLSKDISTELNLGGSLSLPLGETDTLKLSRVIELDDVITENNEGAYEIAKSGNLDLNVPMMEKITIDGMSANPTIEDVFDDAPGMSRPSDFQFTQELNYFSNIDTEEKVPVEAKKITSMYFRPFYAELSIQFSFDDQNTLSKLENLRLSDFTIDFPKFIVFGAGIDGMDYTSNILTINEPIPANGILRKLVPIVDIKNIPDVNQTTHTIKFVREIEFKGNVSADVKGATNEEMSSMIVATEFNIPNFEIEKVKGTFIPEIKVNAENLDMGDIPDALANENTSLNVNNRHHFGNR